MWIQKSRKIISFLFADKGKHSRIRILVSVTNIFIGNQKQCSEIWTQEGSVAFSIKFDSCHEGYRWVHDGGASLQPLRNPMPQMVPSGALQKNIVVIPFWAHFLGSTELSSVRV